MDIHISCVVRFPVKSFAVLERSDIISWQEICFMGTKNRKCSLYTNYHCKWKWSAVSVHGYGPLYLSMDMVRCICPWIWSAVSVHGYGPLYLSMDMVRCICPWIWSAVSVHGYGPLYLVVNIYYEEQYWRLFECKYMDVVIITDNTVEKISSPGPFR